VGKVETLEGMILITTALMLEARPLIAGMGLHASSEGPFPVYLRGDRILVVTGTGPLRASAATAWSIARFSGIRAAVNIGFAGAAPSASPLYKWHLIHSIRDRSTGRLHVPDILHKHPFEEATLLTSGKVIRTDIGWDGLIDMEGSGFYEAARQFLPPDRIALLKWVSDPLSGKVDAASLARRFSGDVKAALSFLEEWPAGAEGNKDEGDGVLQTLLERLQLTVTQERFLEKWLSGYLARGGDIRPVMECLPESRPAHKADNRRALERLKDVLKS
jgi:hypothetical protein